MIWGAPYCKGSPNSLGGPTLIRPAYYATLITLTSEGTVILTLKARNYARYARRLPPYLLLFGSRT